MEVEEDDLEIEALVRELSSDISAREYVYFDADIPTSESMISKHELTGEKGYEKIASMPSQLMLKRRMISKKKESVLLNLSQCLAK